MILFTKFIQDYSFKIIQNYSRIFKIIKVIV